MRTRSQPLSPGGAVSLEKEPPLRPATRKTRSMRTQSTSETSAPSGSSQSQSSAQQQESEESSRPAAGKKSQSASGKSTTGKKGKATKQSTTSTKKTTTTTATAKKSAPGRKAASTKKTDTAASTKTSSKPSKAPTKRATQATTERRSTRRTATKSPEGEQQESTQPSTSPEAVEPDAPAAKSPANPKPTGAESSAADVLLEPNSSKCESPQQVLPSRSQGSQGLQGPHDPYDHKEPKEYPGHEAPKDGPDSLDFASLSLEQFSDIGSPLSELSATPSINLDEASQTMSLGLSAEVAAEAEVGANANTNAVELSLSSPAMPAPASSPDSLQTRGQPDDPLEPVPTEDPLPMDQSSEWSEAMDKLTLLMGNLCLTDPVVDVVAVPVTAVPVTAVPVMASIYADEPPAMPTLPVLDSVRQHPEFQGRCIPFLVASDLPPRVLMYGDDRFAPFMAPYGRPSVEEPQFRLTTRAARVTVPTPLSPVPEEPERVELDTPSPVKVRVASTRYLQELEVDPTPLGPCSKDVPTGRCPRPRKQKQKRPQKESQRRLTRTTVNRKRPRAQSNEEAHETPQAKRRSVRPPVSTSLSRRLLPLSRRLSSTSVPYAERLRRRQAERQGRIHTTVFRLPELVAQNEADRRASENQPSSPSPSPYPPAPETSFDFPETPGLSRTLEEQSSLQEPRTPESPSGWNIRGLLSSVPRSFSRFIPRFGRSQEGADGSDQENQPVVFGQPGADASHQSPPSTPSFPAPSNQPSSEQIQRPSQPLQVPGRRIRTPRTAPAKKPDAKKPDLSYDLFPRPIDRSLYLPSEPSAAKINEAQRGSQQGLEKEKQMSAPSESIAAPAGERATRQTNDTLGKNKRKRSPSPDVIPNPPGCSYGMDLRYFCYSSESEDEDDTSNTTSKPTPLRRSAVRDELESERHPSKRVRFDASPEDTPSKRRGRATDPYHGHHFLSPGEIPSPRGPESTAATPSSPATPTPSTTSANTPIQRPPGFIPNTQGTFGFDYDDFSSDSSSSGPSSPASVASPVSNLPEQQTPRPQSQESLQSPRPTPREAPAAPPSTPATAKIDNEALAKVRSQAEKYKPKTPSGLRTASRYSSSPMVASPDVAPTPSGELEKSISEYSGSDKENAPTNASAPAADKFGDDQFARDAEWLYENCPSGDFSEFAWPNRRDLVEALSVEPASGKISNEGWDTNELEIGLSPFNGEMAEFATALV